MHIAFPPEQGFVKVTFLGSRGKCNNNVSSPPFVIRVLIGQPHYKIVRYNIGTMKEHDHSKNHTTKFSHSEYEPWVNTAAACKHLGISSPTFRRWIKAGKVKVKRTPTGELRFRRSELNELLS